VLVGTSAYPAELDRTVSLPDGGRLHVRPIRPDDAVRLQGFHGRLSRSSIFFRFFSHVAVLTNERAAYFTNLDYDRRMALVAVEDVGDDEAIIGVIRYDRLDDGRAELGLIVEDRFQRHGVGRALFWEIVAAARERGVQTFVANVLPENDRILRLLSDSGLPIHRHRKRDYVEVDVDLTEPPS
jgi:RimJ/RimL family protein N-acetyltransferase